MITVRFYEGTLLQGQIITDETLERAPQIGETVTFRDKKRNETSYLIQAVDQLIDFDPESTLGVPARSLVRCQCRQV